MAFLSLASDLSFSEQFRYSKFLLVTFLRYWMRIDVNSFNAYAEDIFVNPDISYQRVFDKFIDGTDDAKDILNFVELFRNQIPQINERLQNESAEVRNLHSVKVYTSNYRVIASRLPR